MDRLKYGTYVTGMNNALDARGLLCPLPVLKARKRLMALEHGEVLQVTTDDPAAIIDIPHFCAEAGHALLSSQNNDDCALWLIQKGVGKPPA